MQIEHNSCMLGIVVSVSAEERGVSLNLAWSNNSILSGESMGDVGTPQRLPFGFTTNPQLCPHLHNKRQNLSLLYRQLDVVWTIFIRGGKKRKQTHSVVLFALCNYLMPPVPECILCVADPQSGSVTISDGQTGFCVGRLFRLTHTKKSRTCQKVHAQLVCSICTHTRDPVR